MELTEYRLQDLSKIEVQYFTAPSLKQWKLAARLISYRILVVKYIGVFGWGSGGRGDGTFMGAMARAGIHALKPDGIIHDLSELSYEWGDDLSGVMHIGSEKKSKDARAVVVGPKCEDAVRTLCLGEKSREPLEKIGWVFRTLAEARDHVDKHIEWFGKK